MRRRVPLPARAAIAFALAAGRASALDPGKAITQYVHDVWTLEQGLPSSRVHCLLQSRDGYLWLGTEAGLARFDGVRFTVYDRSNTRELVGTDVRGLLEDRDGGLWITTDAERGLTRLKDGRFTLLATKDELPDGGVLLQDRAGSVWIGTPTGLLRWQDGKLAPFPLGEPVPVSRLHEDRDGGLRIGSHGKGLGRWKDGRLSWLTSRDGLSSDDVSAIFEDGDGTLWIGTPDKGLNRLRDGVVTRLTTADGLTSNKIRAICGDPEGSLWVGTADAGLVRLSRAGPGAARRIAAFSAADGLSESRIRSLLLDREGSLWIGTFDGLNRLRDGKLTPFTSREGLPAEHALTICEASDGSLWVGTDLGSVARLERPDGLPGMGTRVTVLGEKEGLAKGWIQSVLEDREGTLWIGTSGGLCRVRDGTPATFTSEHGLAAGPVRALLEARDGGLWVGTGAGLSRMKDGVFTTYTKKDGLCGNAVAALLEDRAGALWIGFWNGGGLCRLKDGRFTSFRSRDALPAEHVTAIHEDRDGVIWLGGLTGLHRLKDGRFASITVRDGLFDDVVFQILEDQSGNLWMSGYQGISRASKADLNAMADGRIARIESVSYGTADGMKSRECNGSWQPAGVKTRDGRLWFPTMKGVVTIDPERILTNQVKPPVVVEDVLFDGRHAERRAGGAALLAPAGTDKLAIHYTAGSLVVPKRVRFRYRLEGYDGGWVEAGTERVAHYTNLPPGTYTFRVAACNDDGLLSDVGASQALELLPRFWQTWWFHGLEAVAAMGLLAGAFVLQRRRLQVRAEHRRMTGELDEARRVQLALLPKAPLTAGPWTVAGRMQTATEVGGDYFGYLETGGRLCVVIGDATGHGMAAGLVAGMLKSATAALSQSAGRSEGPEAWLRGLNAALRSSIAQRGLGVCVAIALLDPESGEVELAVAGIPHPFRVPAEGPVERLPLSGTPLGYLKRIVTATAKRTLAPGDRLVLVTDGLIEQVGPAGEEWGYRGVETALVALGNVGPEAMAEGLVAACDGFAAGVPRSDDRTVVVLARSAV